MTSKDASNKKVVQLFKVIKDNITDLVAVMDKDGKVTIANAAHKKLFGRSDSGSALFSNIHPDDREKVGEMFKKTFSTGKSTTVQYRLGRAKRVSKVIESNFYLLDKEKSGPRFVVAISYDKTERLETQQQIRLLAQAVSSTKDGFILTDIESNLLYVNPTICEMYGFKEEELIGKNISILRPAGTASDLAEQIVPATLNGGWSGELLNRKKGGSIFPIELWTSAIQDENGTVVAMASIVRDISKRKQVEERLKNTAERLQLTLDNLNILVFEFDAEGKLSLLRGKALEKFGLPQGETVGLSVFDIYKGYPEIIEIIQKAYTGEIGIRDIDINKYVWSLNLIPLKNAKGKVERVFGTAIDVTERKRAEEALSHESVLWHALMDNITDTIYFKDNHSRFTRINKAQGRVLNIDQLEEAIGKTDFDFFPEAHAKQAFADELEILKTGRPVLGKVEKIVYRESKTQWFLTTKVPIYDSKGKISGIVGSSRDITDLKSAEELQGALYKIAEETSSAADLQKVFSTIHSIIGELMYAGNFFIALYNSENDLLTFPYFVDEVDIPPDPGTAGDGLTAYVLRTGKSLLCDQKVSDELERRGDATLVGVPSPIWLGVPLIVEGKTIGAMVVQHYSDPHAYGDREKFILEFVSSQVAKTIQRRRTQEALKESQDRYRAFVEQSTEGIWRFQADVPVPCSLTISEQINMFFRHFYLAECNDTMAQMYGFNKASEILGMKLSDMLVESDPRNNEMFQSFVKSGYKLTQAESREMDRYGNQKIFLNNFVGVLDQDTIIGWWGTQIDVTEKRHAEELLIESEEKYRTLFEESQDCIILSKPDGTLLDINPAGVAMFGYKSRDEILLRNRAMELYANVEDRDRFKKHIDDDGIVRDLESVIKQKNGEKRVILESSSVVRDAKKNVIAYRSFLRDITERKKLEEQLRQAQKMESIGTLAGGIAHDFNNLLGIILGYVSLLENSKFDPAKGTQSVEVIKKAVQRGADLVKQLLTFARKGEPSFVSMDVNEAVNELVGMLNQTFPKTIKIVCELSEILPTIIADPSQFNQALLNLCVNSRDAMVQDKPGVGSSGTLTIRTGFLTEQAVREKYPSSKPTSYIMISVSDTGIGMDEKILARMFEPFFTTKEIGKGTGLGLAVVYGVINSHSGFVDVKSTKGAGSTFTLFFPVPAQSVAERKPANTASHELIPGSETILLVEDEEMLALLLRGLLEDQGYKVFIAKDGLEGLELYRAHHPDIHIILSDMGLPNLGGYEMFMKMKEINPDVKAILASGYFNPNLKIELINEGAKDFIQKPYIAEEVLGRIRDILDGK